MRVQPIIIHSLQDVPARSAPDPLVIEDYHHLHVTIRRRSPRRLGRVYRAPVAVVDSPAEDRRKAHLHIAWKAGAISVNVGSLMSVEPPFFKKAAVPIQIFVRLTTRLFIDVALEMRLHEGDCPDAGILALLTPMDC